MKASQTLRALAKTSEKVKEYEFDGESHWLHLENGYICTLTETHSIHEDTVLETLHVFRNFIAPCKGACCKPTP